MRIMSSGFGNLSGCLCKTMKMTGYEDQDSGPCICLGLFFGRRQIQDEGQWERQFCPFGTITTWAEQSRWPGLKAPIRHLWLMSSSRPFWSKQQKVKWHGHRWTQMPLHRHLNCSWGALASPLPVCWHSSSDHSAPGSSTGAWSHKLFFQGIILCWRKTASQSPWAGVALNCQPCSSSSAGCYLLLAEK